MMPKDSLIFGALAGMAGNIVKEAIVWSLHFLKLIKYTFVHIAAGYFVPKTFLDSPVSLMIGFVAD